MNRFTITKMSICIMLTLVALPAKAERERDFDVIVNFEADMVAYIADTGKHVDHTGKCGISAGANIPRKFDRNIFVSLFGCLFDSDGEAIATDMFRGFDLTFSDSMTSITKEIVEMSLSLQRNSTGKVVGLTMWVKDDSGEVYANKIGVDGPTITQNSVPNGPILAGHIFIVTAEAGNGRGKKNRGNKAVLTADVTLVDIEFIAAP